MAGADLVPVYDDGPARALLGEMLVAAKVITPEQLNEVLRAAREPGKKLGQLLIERGWLTEGQLTQTLSLQLSVPWVSLNHIDFSRQLLNRVSHDLAERYCLVPIFVRHVKGQGETLYVAMDDPTNGVALAEVARQAGLPTRPMIASASDIRQAIRFYYGEPVVSQVVDVPVPPPTSSRRSTPPPATARVVMVEAAPEPRRSDRPPLPPSSPPPRRSSAPPPPREIASGADVPAEASPPTTRSSAPPSGAPSEGRPRRRVPRMVSLTLLDGTTIQLPARPKTKQAGFASKEGLTARELVAALRAAASTTAEGAEAASDKPQWEPIVAALISLLVRKGVVSDAELMEELRK